MAKRMTQNQKEYEKEKNRLLREIKKAEKKGYIFDEDIIPQAKKRISKKAIKEIKAIKNRSLYNNANYLDTETGELIPALEHQEQEKKKKREQPKKKIEKAKIKLPSVSTPKDTKPKEKLQSSQRKYFKKGKKINSPTQDILKTIRDKIGAIPDELEFYKSGDVYHMGCSEYKNALMSIFDDRYSEAESLDDLRAEYMSKEYDIMICFDTVEYESEQWKVERSFSHLGELLKGGSMTPKEANGVSNLAESNTSYED